MKFPIANLVGREFGSASNIGHFYVLAALVVTAIDFCLKLSSIIGLCPGFLFDLTFFMQEPTLLTLENSAQIFNALSDLPGEMIEPKELIQVMVSKMTSFFSMVY